MEDLESVVGSMLKYSIYISCEEFNNNNYIHICSLTTVDSVIKHLLYHKNNHKHRWIVRCLQHGLESYGSSCKQQGPESNTYNYDKTIAINISIPSSNTLGICLVLSLLTVFCMHNIKRKTGRSLGQGYTGYLN